MVKKNVFSWKVFFLKYLSKKSPLWKWIFMYTIYSIMSKVRQNFTWHCKNLEKLVEKHAEIKDGWINSIWVNTRQENYMASIFLKYFVVQMFKVKAS